MILVSRNMRSMGIFVGVPLGGGIKWEWGCRGPQFLAIWVATSSESSEIRLALLHYCMATCYSLLAGNWMQNEWPWMTLSGYFMSKSVFGQHSIAEYRCVFWSPLHKFNWMKIDPYYQRQKCRPMNLVSENIRFMRIFAGVPLARASNDIGGCRRRQFLAI